MNKILPKIEYLGELRKLATTDGPFKGRYERLAMIAASNLGQPCRSVGESIRSLNNMANETNEDGVVDEINFVRDIELAQMNEKGT